MWGDFNEIDGDGLLAVPAMPHLGDVVPRPGTRLTLADGDGNQCQGTVQGSVRRTEGWLIYIELDWSTWNPSEE